MATILPAPESQWIDQNGNPLEAGTIETFVPGTSTPKLSWQDADQLVLNTNPIILDAAGRAIIYGSGVYRFIVRDSAGNLVYDQLTADTSSGGIANGGTSTGTPNAQIVDASGFSQQDGQALEFIAGFSNSGPMTVAPGGGAGIPVLIDTSTGPSPLSGGEVVEDNAVLLLYEAARGAFHIVNPTPGSFTGATISNSTITNSTIETTQIDLSQAIDPTPTAEGRTEWSTLFNNIKIGDGSGTQRFWSGAAPGAISGCTIANNGTDATNDIDFAAGTVSDSTSAFYMTTGALTKRLDATWAVGSNQGGLFSGAIANTTYHCFIIMRPDTGVVDAGFDTSAIAANRPASYTYYRRVGSIVRSSAAIRAFVQFGDTFNWGVPIQDRAQATAGSTSAQTLTLSLPAGIVIESLTNWYLIYTSNTGEQAILVTPLSVTDSAPSTSLFSLYGGNPGSIAFQYQSQQMRIFTNTSAAIRWRASNSGQSSFAVTTIGWVDTRGR